MGRPFGCLYRTRTRSKVQVCPGQVERLPNGKWKCVECRRVGTGENTYHNKVLIGRFWWLKYTDQYGKTRWLNTYKVNRAAAEKVRRIKAAEVWAGLEPQKRHEPTVREVLALIETDYEIKQRRTHDKTILNTQRLEGYFGVGAKAHDITESRIREYILFRRKQGAANASINRELATLRRAFRLAHRTLDPQGRPLVSRVPYIEMLEEPPPRQGFVEAGEARALIDHAAPFIRPLLEFLHITGWRPSEPLAVEWRHVDWDAGLINAFPRGTTKTKKGREPLPFGAHPRLDAILRSQRAVADEIQMREGRIVTHVFFRPNGDAIESYRHEWEAARKAAGLPNKLRHDFRRTAARNLLRAGVQRRVAMKITGHLTESVFERYNITTAEDTADALRKVAGTPQPQAQLVLPFGRRGRDPSAQ